MCDDAGCEDLTFSHNSADVIMRDHQADYDYDYVTLPSLCAVACDHRKMMEVCGEAENRLASELMQHELQIEKDVLDPLSQLAEVRNFTLSECYGS